MGAEGIGFILPSQLLKAALVFYTEIWFTIYFKTV